MPLVTVVQGASKLKGVNDAYCVALTLMVTLVHISVGLPSEKQLCHREVMIGAFQHVLNTVMNTIHVNTTKGDRKSVV